MAPFYPTTVPIMHFVAVAIPIYTAAVTGPQTIPWSMPDARTVSRAAAPPVLERTFSPRSGRYCVHWNLSSRELSSDGSRLMSHPFTLSFGDELPDVSFKIMLYAARARSFKKSRGQGYFELRCESSVPSGKVNLAFRISIEGQAPRGPVENDFASMAACGLPKGQEVWNLSNAVDPQTKTCRVCLEVLPNGSMPAPTLVPDVVEQNTSGAMSSKYCITHQRV